MALRKTVLIHFLEDTRDRLRGEINNKYNEKINAEEKVLYNKLEINESLDKYQKSINEICEFHNKIINSKTLIENKIEISTWYSSPYARLNELAGSDYITKMKKSFNYFSSPTIVKLNRQKDKDLYAITDTYNNLIAICRNITSGKKIQTYLEGLGYDLTELYKKEHVEVSLVAPLNINNLGIEMANTLNNKKEGNE